MNDNCSSDATGAFIGVNLFFIIAFFVIIVLFCLQGWSFALLTFDWFTKHEKVFKLIQLCIQLFWLSFFAGFGLCGLFFHNQA